jgi:glycosyltransferase involved in cell wall biosynthesis
VLEEINTLPYFTPLWSSAPVLLYMNQLARDVWWYEAPMLVAATGWVAEPLYLKAYRSCDAITISRSSRDDLRRFGIRGEITVTPLAVDVGLAPSLPPKRRVGSMIAIGRLTPSKRYDHAIQALAVLREVRPSASLTILGDGRDRRRLEHEVERLGLRDSVTIRGRVPEAEKIQEIDYADVLVGTSVREGWGLTVTEAGARGTPAVVYDIPGFRDAVVPGRTGELVEATPDALARGVRALIDDADRYDAIRRAAWLAAADLTHEATVNAFEEAINRCRAS